MPTRVLPRRIVAAATMALFPFASLVFSQPTAVPAGPATGTASAAGVSSAESETDEVVTLSPFNVDATKDQGYRATSTLAGSRINTSLKDVASSVTVITAEFLKDTASVDINDVLVYMANTESTQNYTDAPLQGIGGYEDRTSTSPMTANRIRGLSNATITRDYFISIGAAIGFDAYNLDRITVNRGPNSILFGLGDPSGIVDYSPKQAMLGRNANEVGLRYGSHDDLRTTVDFNRVLIEDKLAFRIAGMWADRGFEQQPSWFKDKRIYLTGTYRPFEKTTLRVGYERTSQDQNSPNSITPIDHVTSWNALGRPTWNPSTQLWSARPPFFASTAGGSAVGATGPDGALEYVFDETQGEMSWATFWQPSRTGVFVQTSYGLSDDRYVPLHKLNLRPTLTNYDMDTFTASWEQELVKDLFLNVALLREDLDRSGFNFVRSNQFGVYVDVNSRLPNGSVNPHFGETFMPQRSLDSMNGGEDRNEALRATATYQLDFAKSEGWLRHLGRHSFTGYAERREVNRWSELYNGVRSGTVPYYNQNNRIDGDWQLTRVRYLGGTADTPAIYAPSVPVTGMSGVPNTYWNATAGAWANDTYAEFFALKRRDVSQNILTSRAFVWQGFLLDGRIVGTLGWRHDKAREQNKSSTGPINASTGGYLVPDDTYPTPRPAPVAGPTKTMGVVVHPTEWLSLHYNESENFVAAAGNVNIFGETIGPPSGDGKDFGFSLDLFESKLNVRVNWYEVAQQNARITNAGPDILAQWELPWFDQVVIPLLAAQYNLTHDSSDFFSPVMWGDNRIEETADVVSEGVEIELTYNPTSNWRITANASSQEAAKANIGAGLSRWVEEILPTWQNQPWWSGPQTVDAGWGVTQNLQGYFNAFNTGRVLPTFKSEEGLTSPQLRKWRFNFINNYTFTEGRLRGWNAGGAVRWEDAAAIGYPAITGLVNGVESLIGLDLANPYRDGKRFNMDLWVGYSRRIWNDRVDWNLQLNLRNATESRGFEAINKDSNGDSSVFRIKTGRTWYLSSGFNW